MRNCEMMSKDLDKSRDSHRSGIGVMRKLREGLGRTTMIARVELGTSNRACLVRKS
jgi:hypothetical protein